MIPPNGIMKKVFATLIHVGKAISLRNQMIAAYERGNRPSWLIVGAGGQAVTRN